MVKNDQDIQMVFAALKKLQNPPDPIEELIGFNVGKNK